MASRHFTGVGELQTRCGSKVGGSEALAIVQDRDDVSWVCVIPAE